MRKKYSALKKLKCIFAVLKKGDVSEWLKEHAWKVCIGVTLSRVRISPSPQKKGKSLLICLFYLIADLLYQGQDLLNEIAS
jgi:hypothetical protein